MLIEWRNVTMTLSEAIKKIRKERFLSQEEFAKDIGVAFSTVNRWENGKAQPSYKAMKTLNDYCKRYSIDISIADTE
jgi:DNA-binding transcriptional regulator YiaG